MLLDRRLSRRLLEYLRVDFDEILLIDGLENVRRQVEQKVVSTYERHDEEYEQHEAVQYVRNVLPVVLDLHTHTHTHHTN